MLSPKISLATLTGAACRATSGLIRSLSGLARDLDVNSRRLHKLTLLLLNRSTIFRILRGLLRLRPKHRRQPQPTQDFEPTVGDFRGCPSPNAQNLPNTRKQCGFELEAKWLGSGVKKSEERNTKNQRNINGKQQDGGEIGKSKKKENVHEAAVRNRADNF